MSVEKSLQNEIEKGIYFPIESDGVCKRKSCINYKWAIESGLANGYCMECWDNGYGFKKGDIQYGYRFKEQNVDQI